MISRDRNCFLFPLNQIDEISLAMQVANLGLWRIPAHSNKIWMNTKMLSDLGLTAETNALDIEEMLKSVIPEDRSTVAGMINKARTGETYQNGFNLTFRINKANSDCAWLEWNAIPSPNTCEYGALIGVSKEISKEIHKIRLHSLADKSPAFLWIVEPEGVLVSYNQSFANYFALPAGKSISRKWLELVHPEDRLHANQHWQSSVIGGEPFEMEIRLQKADGSSRWFFNKCAKYDSDAQDSKAHWIVTSFDLQSKQYWNVNCELPRLMLAKAASVAKIGFYDWDIKNNCVSFSDQMKDDWGIDRNDNVSDALSMIHPADRERVRVAIRGAIEQHQPYFAQYRVIRPKDNKITWIEAKGEVTYNTQNEAIRFFGTSIDITEQRNNQDILQNMIDNMPLLTGLISPDGKILRINQTAAKLHQKKPEECIGIEVWRLNCWQGSPRSVDCVRDAIQQAAAGKPQRLDVQYWVHQGDGKEQRWVDLLITPIFSDDGTVCSLVKTGFDITERFEQATELAEARSVAEKASLTKSAFLANMSHEIRTPLSAILGYSELLKEPHLAASEKQHYLETICNNGETLTKIIDDILDLAKVESGKLNVECLEFSLFEKITGIFDLFSKKAAQKNICLRLNMNENIPKRICSDPTKIKQILTNLIGNAVKFTHDGEIAVRVEPMDDNWISIEIQDSGIGLSEEQMQQLFRPFVQADSSTVRRFGGTGLGLVLSRRLAQALGGEVNIIRSEIDVGSVFSFKFPFISAAHSSHVTSEEIAERGVEGYRILLIDDSEDSLYLVKRMLLKAGAQIEAVNSGKKGLERIQAREVDLVLLDIQMPEMDGYQTIEQLRRMGFKKPVIALTAHGMHGEKEKTRACGFQGHLTKPMKFSSLSKAINEALHLYSQQEHAK